MPSEYLQQQRRFCLKLKESQIEIVVKKMHIRRLCTETAIFPLVQNANYKTKYIGTKAMQ